MNPGEWIKASVNSSDAVHLDICTLTSYTWWHSCTYDPTFSQTGSEFTLLYRFADGGTWYISVSNYNTIDVSLTTRAIVLLPVSITLTLASPTPTFGKPENVSATFNLQTSSGNVTLYTRNKDQSGNDVLAQIGQGTPQNGKFNITWTPTAAGSYALQAVWDNETHHGETGDFPVNVAKANSTIQLTSPSATTIDPITRSPATVRVDGQLEPPAATGHIIASILDPTGARSTSDVTLRSDGAFTLTFPAAHTGNWYVNLTWIGDQNHNEAQTATRVQVGLNYIPYVALVMVAVIGSICVGAWQFRKRAPAESGANSEVLPDSKDVADRTLRMLTDWRRVTAAAGHMAETEVFSDETLAAIAAQRPGTKRDLYKVKGINELSAMLHCQDVLRMVAAATEKPRKP